MDARRRILHYHTLNPARRRTASYLLEDQHPRRRLVADSIPETIIQTMVADDESTMTHELLAQKLPVYR